MKFSTLRNKILTDIRIDYEHDEITFVTQKHSYKLYHHQDCCESVTINDVTGNISNLLNTPILIAREDTNSKREDIDESHTWTFYNLSTVKGDVTIRFYGTSNGYYSESVDFIRE